RGQVSRALEAAFEADVSFKKRLLERGKEFLSGLKHEDIALVIIGRSYNTMDSGINLELPQKLRDLNIPAIPFDMLPIEDEIDDSLAKDMYWKSGQRILAAAKYISRDPRLFAVYITNFGCGPDSFISHFFKDMSKGKPFLQLEIDEHSADAGAITRCEAFIDSLRNVRSRLKPVIVEKSPVQRTAVRKKLYLSNMADASLAVAAAFQASGIEAEVMPESDEETVRTGRMYTSGRECYPTVLTTGDMIKVTKRPDFDPHASAFFMPSGNGPCRFGQYNRYHRLVLDEAGFKDVPIYAPDQDEAFYKEIGIIGGDFLRLAWWGIVTVDLLEKRAREVRPYETDKGETGRVYREYLKRMCDAIRQKRFPGEEMNSAKKAFNAIPVKGIGEKPVVAIVGEIYVRSNRFSNDNLIGKIEALGAEARMPPIAEWVSYTNYYSKQKNWEKRSFGNYLRTLIQDYYQHSYGTRLENIFDGDLRGGHEPQTEEILRLASPYIHESFEGEAILSVGKVIDYLAKGAHGIINAMPFTCMPGTVVNAVLKRVREDSGNAPYLNMVYEGIEDTNTLTRLEAFVYQAREFMERRQV
ncbi:MAG: CoA activase, partial [Deltaproteobacteria bacterium]|nr:CoA activase [Deltaproteobacteria bacterium]